MVAEPGGWGNGAIRLHRNLESSGVQSCHQSAVDLQQRLAAGEHDETVLLAAPPLRLDRVREVVLSRVAVPARSIGTHKIRVTERALRAAAVLLAPRPEIAAGKATEHSWAPRMRTLTLQGQENFFHGITHDRGFPAWVRSV